jgi:4-amino-4-deoxy-L-arabinose transferase-like glycosyltransferase
MNLKGLLVFVLLISAAVTAFSMLSRRTLDSHECFVSVTAREMIQKGNWILPTLNNQQRINKTPLSYWLVAGFGKMTGKIDAFTARFPNAVFSFLSAFILLYFVNKFLSFRIAIISVAVWVTSLGYFRASHSARPDTALTFFVMICFLAFYAAVTSQNRREQIIFMLVFWTSLGLGMLAKGPAPLPYVFIPLFFYVAFERKWKIIPKLLPIIGLVIFAVIVLPWPLAIAYKVNWNLVIWKREFFDRLFGEYAPGHYPIYFYFLIIFKYITPWFILLPAALISPFYRVWERKQPVMKFLWFWFAADFVFLTIDACKRQHYLLPLMPAICILTGIIIDDIVFVKKAFDEKMSRNIWGMQLMGVILFIVSGIIFVIIKAPSGIVVASAAGIISITGIIFALLLYGKNKPVMAVTAAFAGVAVWSAVFYTTFWVTIDVDRYSRDFAKTVAVIIPESGELVAYKHVSSRFVQYFGRTVVEINDPNEVYKHYEDGDWILCGSDYLEEFNSHKHLRTVYLRNIIEGEEKGDAGGAIFHKTAPVRADIDKGEIEAGPLTKGK